MHCVTNQNQQRYQVSSCINLTGPVVAITIPTLDREGCRAGRPSHTNLFVLEPAQLPVQLALRGKGV